MTETDEYGRVAQPRSDETPEWEVFLRETTADPLRHAGSVTAPSSAVAHEHAATLFPDAGTRWLCRSDDVVRFADRELGSEYETTDGPAAPDATDTGDAGPADSDVDTNAADSDADTNAADSDADRTHRTAGGDDR